MRMNFAEAAYLKTLTKILKVNCKGIHFRPEPDGVWIFSADSANVAYFQFFIKSSCMVSYDYEKGKDSDFTINVLHLGWVMDTIGKDDILDIEADTETNMIYFKIIGTEQSMFKFNILDGGMHKNFDGEWTSDVKIPVAALNRAVKKSILIGDATKFRITDEIMKVFSEDEINEVATTFNILDNTEIAAEVKSEGEVKVAHEYLKQAKEMEKSFGNVNIKVKTDYPLCLFYELEDKIEASIIIAPRVVADD